MNALNLFQLIMSLMRAGQQSWLQQVNWERINKMYSFLFICTESDPENVRLSRPSVL